MNQPSVQYQTILSAHEVDNGSTNRRERFPWIVMVAGMFLFFLGVHFTVTRPMQLQMIAMQEEMQQTQQSLEGLVGAKDDVWKTNDLMTALRKQSNQQAEMAEAMLSIQNFRKDVQAEAGKTTLAMNEIKKIGKLHQEIASQNEVHQAAKNSFEQVVALQNDLSDLQVEISKSMSEVKDVHKMIEELTSLKTQLVTDVTGLKQARQNLDHLVAMQADIVRSGHRQKSAETSLGKMKTLQTDLIASLKDNRKAAQSVKELTRMQSQLSSVDNKTATSAKSSLDSMIAMQETLATNKKSVHIAIETLELMDDFQSEVTVRVTQIKKMRRQLMEVALMEPSVKRVANILKPLTELTALESMNMEELQAAARAIIQHKAEMKAMMVEQKMENASAGKMAAEKTAANQGLEIPTAEETTIK